MARTKEVNNKVIRLAFVDSFVFREEEGIELQVLSNKPSTSTTEATFGNIPLSVFGEAAALPSTDADSVDSGEYEEIGAEKPSSTIGRIDDNNIFKFRVHFLLSMQIYGRKCIEKIHQKAAKKLRYSPQ